MSEVTEVRADDHGWEVHMGSSVFYIAKKSIDWGTANETEIKVGDEITLYPPGWGSRVYGVDLNGERLYQMTDREIELEQELSRESGDRKKRERFEREKARLDADFESLPRIFQERIERRRTNNPDFRHEYESYEMFVCKQAVALATHAAVEAIGVAHGAYSDSEAEQIDQWILDWDKVGSKEGGYDHKKQHKMFSGYSDQHSGNTYGAMVTLARLYVRNPERVPDLYGALSPLVGSEAYGDVPAKVSE